MARKPKVPILVAKCEVDGCAEDAAYGFREWLDGNTMTTTGFAVGFRKNWCEKHDAQERTSCEELQGDFVVFKSTS